MITGTLKRIAQMLWGKFESKQEFMKFLLLAVIMGLIICVYWSLRPIKDTIFYVVVGGNFIARAKIVSLLNERAAISKDIGKEKASQALVSFAESLGASSKNNVYDLRASSFSPSAK